MRLSRSRLLMLVAASALFSLPSQCPARDLLLNSDAEEGHVTLWVAGRAKQDSIPGSGGSARAVALRITRLGNNNQVQARLFTYSQVAGGHYRTRDEYTTAANQLQGTVETRGNGRNRRQTVTLENADVNAIVYLTAVWRRNKGGETQRHVMCRVKFVTQAAAPVADTEAAAQVPVNCDEPPAEDILEEETYIDPDMDEVPDEDPEYYDDDPPIP